jgi:hypothetical protein
MQNDDQHANQNDAQLHANQANLAIANGNTLLNDKEI